MELKIKFLKWSAGIPVAMIHQKTATKMGIHLNGRILIKSKSKEMCVVTDTVEGLVKENEVAVSSEIKKTMNLKKGEYINISLCKIPESLSVIKKKLQKKPFSEKDINLIISDIVDNSLSDPELALFVSAMYQQGMTMKETVYLIEAILKFGNKLSLNKKYVVDKHCIGGVPGNRTTPIVVSICAAAGLTFPKTSSRAITSAAGTADVIEAIAQVDFSIKDLKKIIQKTNACLAWGGSLGIMPADSKILEMEKELNLDPEAQLLASIMAKKLAVGSNYILIDIPFGKNAKVSKKKAIALQKKFEILGKYFHKNLKVVLTKGDEPIGQGVGPVLELLDILSVLDPLKNSPKDLEKKSLFLSGQILEMTKKAKKGEGIELAQKILDSGKAFKKFKEIIEAQRGHINGLKPASFVKEIKAKKSGKIIEINNKQISSLARSAGCPVDKQAGLFLNFHVGAKVKKDQTILKIYAESKSRLNEAIENYNQTQPIKIK